MSKIQVNDIVNHFDDGAPNFPKGIAVGSGATLGLNVGTGASIYSPSDNVLTLGTNNTEKVRITSGGNVGINRIDPDQKLNVNGNIEVNAYDSSSGAGGYYTAKGLIIGNAYDAGKTANVTDDRNAIIWQERGLDLDIATSDILRMKITYDGKVGIGTDVIPSNTKLLVAGTNSTNYLGLENITPSNSNASRWSFILFKGRKADSTVGTLATINAEHDGTGDDLKGSLVFDVHNGTDTVEAARFTSSGNLAFPNGQGIDFSATADGSGTTASEVLDDYEEGTWTPTLSFNGASTGITYGTQQGGTYTKTGRFVFLDVLITLSNKGSSTGLLNINNLPFANASYDNSRMHGGMTYYDNFANLNTAVYLYKGAGGQTSIDAFMLDASDGTASDNVNVGSSNLTNTTTFRAWVSYYTD